MGRIANFLWALAVGVFLAAVGLATDMNMLFVAAMALAGMAAVFSFLDWWMRPSRRVFLEPGLTQEFVSGLFAGRTKVQAKQAISIYLGKWVKVSGALDDVVPLAATIGGRSVSLEGKPVVFADFRFGARRLDVLQKGEVLEIQGKIANISPSWVGLTKCELISVSAPKT